MLKEKLISCTQVAQTLGVDKETVRRWCRSGKLPAIKVGQAWVVIEADLTTFLENKDQEAVARLRGVMSRRPAVT